MNKKKDKIVVTGGAGFIGSHVVKLFCDKGYKVTVIDDLSLGYKELLDKRAEFLKGRIQDDKITDSALKDAKIVIHLAADSIIKFSFIDPIEHFKNNILGGIKLLEAMRRNNVRKMIFSSSAAVYGDQNKIPIKEEVQKNPRSPYGASKLAFESILQSYYYGYGIESVSLRYFCAYGPNDKQNPPTRAVPVWSVAILKNKQVPLFWHGNQIRDYVYVGDVASAHYKARNLSGINFINIGSGKGIRMKDFLKEMEKIANKKAIIKHKGERIGDPPYLVADIQKAKKILNWEPKISLSTGLKHAISYYKNNLLNGS